MQVKEAGNMADYVRCIHFSSNDGSKEGVIFTEDFEEKTEDFIPPGCTLDGETEDIKLHQLPSSFPLDRVLWRE
jgi:hypothetical protein